MRAAYCEREVELMDDIHAFCCHTGIIADAGRLESLGFQLDNVSGAFDGSYVLTLLAFCQKNQDN